jgi:hypothetical protein
VRCGASVTPPSRARIRALMYSMFRPLRPFSASCAFCVCVIGPCSPRLAFCMSWLWCLSCVLRCDTLGTLRARYCRPALQSPQAVAAGHRPVATRHRPKSRRQEQWPY